MRVGHTEADFSVVSPKGSLNRANRFVGSCIPEQCREVRGFGFDSDDSRCRVLQREQNARHADMGADIHDCAGAKIRNVRIIRLALKDQNVPVSTKIRRIDSEVYAVIRLKRDDSQFAWSAAQTKRSHRADTAAST